MTRKKIIKFSNGKYFGGFDENDTLIESNVLQAKMFNIKEIWYEETELNDVIKLFDEWSIDYTIMIFSYFTEEL